MVEKCLYFSICSHRTYTTFSKILFFFGGQKLWIFPSDHSLHIFPLDSLCREPVGGTKTSKMHKRFSRERR